MDQCVWAQKNNSPSCGSSKMSQKKTRLRSRWSAVSSAKLVMWRLFHLSIVGRSILSGTPQFVCLKSAEKFEKRTREDKSLFTMAMRDLTHRLKPAPFLTGKNVELMGHLPYSLNMAPNDFFLFPHIKKNAWSTNFVTRRCCWSVQKPCFEGISIGVKKSGRTSKHSE